MSRPGKNQPQIAKTPFKQLRLNAKITQEQLARDIGVAVSTIRRWEKGQAEPTLTVQQMKAALSDRPNFFESVTQLFNYLMVF